MTASDDHLPHGAPREAIGLPPGATAAGAGEDEAKYATTNPVVHRLLTRFIADLRLACGTPTEVVVDVGVGEGLSLDLLAFEPRALIGVEYRADKLARATARLPQLLGLQADAGLLPLGDNVADLVVCLEVLEHLVDPARAVVELARICRGTCVVSVPHEPFFRLGNLARGKDIRRLGNNPEHVGQFRPSSLAKLLGASFAEVRVERSFPWLIGIATTPL